MKKYADHRRKDSPRFKEGQLVWLDLHNIKTGRPTRKLDMGRTGPFPVVKKINPVAYQIKLPLSWRVHPVFHVSLLKLAHINESLHLTTPDDTLQPPPDIIDGDEEYGVDSILDHHDVRVPGTTRTGKRRRKQREYFVKWTGYSAEHNTWEPIKNLRHAPEAIAQYWQ